MYVIWYTMSEYNIAYRCIVWGNWSKSNSKNLFIRSAYVCIFYVYYLLAWFACLLDILWYFHETQCHNNWHIFDRMMCTGGMEICLRLPWPFCTNMQSKETSLKSRKPCGKFPTYYILSSSHLTGVHIDSFIHSWRY